jgi:Flp pilus assembly pilin Flp
MNLRRHTSAARAELGQTMTEYAVMLALIFAVVVATLPLLGAKVTSFFTTMTGAF